MKPEEHMLMITLLAAQLHHFQALYELLQSRGIVEPSDPAAFVELVRNEERASGDLVHSAFEYYLALAKTVGVDTGLASQGT